MPTCPPSREQLDGSVWRKPGHPAGERPEREVLARSTSAAEEQPSHDAVYLANRTCAAVNDAARRAATQTRA